MSIPLFEKYRPLTSSEVPQPTAVSQIKQFLHSFKNQKKKGIILYGPSGTGKTSAVHAIANELNLELMEVNASDIRNSSSLQDKVGNALNQQSLFYSGKIILIDEVDGVSGKEDRGGVSTVSSFLLQSTYPIIMTANDPWDKNFSALRSKCTLINFKALDYRTISNILKNVCDKEKIIYQESELNTIAIRAGGDLRAALNDVESINHNGKLRNDLLEHIDSRNKDEGILQALVKVFKTTDPNIAVSAFDNVTEKTESLFLWMDENIPKEYSGKELFEAYDKLSRADVFFGRIIRRQHWRFLTYSNILITAGIAVSKEKAKKGFTKYSPTTRILKMWRAKMKNAAKKNISVKLSNIIHCSRRKTYQEMPIIKNIAKHNKKFKMMLETELELDEKEIEWLAS